MHGRLRLVEQGRAGVHKLPSSHKTAVNWQRWMKSERLALNALLVNQVIAHRILDQFRIGAQAALFQDPAAIGTHGFHAD